MDEDKARTRSRVGMMMGELCGARLHGAIILFFFFLFTSLSVDISARQSRDSAI